jgi:hypothetical protein
MSLGHNQPQQAIDLLQPASHFEVSLPLHSVYLRGEAFLAMGKAPQAAEEFQKIVDRPACDV